MRGTGRRLRIALLVLISLLTGACFCISLVSTAIEDANKRELARRYGSECALGEDMVLEGDDASPPKIEGPIPGMVTTLEAGLPFTGKMRLRIDGVRVYDDLVQAGISLDDDGLHGNLFGDRAPSNEDFLLLLCDITVTNDSAQLDERSVTRTGKHGFMLDQLVAPVLPFYSLEYFDDGTDAFCGVGERGYFMLAPGESRAIRIGYAIHPNDIPETRRFEFRCGATQSMRYRFLCDSLDMREGVSE